MNTKKLAGVVLLAGASLMMLAGCGGGDSSSGGSSSASKNEITFWNPFVGADGDNMKKLIDDYNKTNPEYKVKKRLFERKRYVYQNSYCCQFGQKYP